MNRSLLAIAATLLALIAAAPAAAQSGPPAAGNEIDWGFRESFRSYVHAGNGTPPIAMANGAICDANPNTAKSGCDPAGEFKWLPIGSDAVALTGNGTIAGQGVLAFSYPAHNFALKIEDPWLIVDGLPGSQTVTLRGGLKLKSTQPGTPSATVRVDIGTFPLTSYTPGMASNAWVTGPGAITKAASDAVGGGFLNEGDILDALSFSVPNSIGAPPASEPVPVADPDPVDPGTTDPGPTDPGPADPGTQQPTPQQPTTPADGGGSGITTPPPTTTPADFGAASIAPRAAALKQLKQLGVKVTATRPAKATSKQWTFPVVGGSVGSSARLDHGGSLKLTTKIKKKTRTVTLTRLRATLGKKSTISATISGKPQTVFVVTTDRRKLVLSTATPSAALSGGKVAFSKGAAKAIAKKLGLKKLPATTLGTLAVMAKLHGAPAATTTPTTGTPTTPGTDAPVSQPITDEPPVLTRPAGAVDVAGATVTWHVRESWIRYINSGEGVTASAGATPHPARNGEGTDVPLVYEFDYGFSSGWYESATGNAALYTGGTVNFSYKDHGIDLDTKNAEVELNGGTSRVIMRFAGRQNTDPGNKRAVLVDLHLDQAKSKTVSPDGKTITYTEIPGTIPQGGSSSVFAGFYMPGDPFGAFTVVVRVA